MKILKARKKVFVVSVIELTQKMKDGYSLPETPKDSELPPNVSAADSVDKDFKMMNALGLMEAMVGDFHVTGYGGETYFITRQVFLKTYDVLGAGAPPKDSPSGKEQKKAAPHSTARRDISTRRRG